MSIVVVYGSLILPRHILLSSTYEFHYDAEWA